jgi:threonine synthase
MHFRSTRAHEPQVSFKDAVLRCLPGDGGLYVPSAVMDLRQFFLYMGEDTSYPELAATVAPALLQGELNPFSASRVAESAFDFEPELVQLDERFSLLKLYNGPTGVFKDFGIAFIAAVLEELLKNSGHAMILSAVRGDTGASMAQAFRKRPGIYSVMLYPSGQIRGIDPRSFVTRGGNIIPIQVRGTFDDCQRLVTEAILDRPFAERHGLTSANTINPGRLLPQTFYFLYAFIKLKKQLKGDLLFSVPSGNFGNLIAGLYAWKFGMPVNGFIAAMNITNAFGDYIQGKQFRPHPAVNTNSPALDVGSPSNFDRLAAFYGEAPAVMRNMVHPEIVRDGDTEKAISGVWSRYGQLLDPHGAVAFAGAERLLASEGMDDKTHAVILATGHPAREGELVSRCTGETVELPEKLAALRRKADPIALIDPELAALESAIASCF